MPRGGFLGRTLERCWAEAESWYRAQLLDSLTADPDALLLDVGCDDGEWTDAVRKRIGITSRQVSGLELVEERAELAQARGFDVRTGDLDEPWPFEDRAFDVVHANQVIEHVTRLDHFVSELRRVLARGGTAVVCTENLASWHNVAPLALGYQPFSLTNVSRMRPIGNPFALHADETPVRPESWQHVHVLTLAGLREIFETHGFTIERSWGAGYYPFPRRLARAIASRDARHAHFIAVIARSPSVVDEYRVGRRRLPVES
jgi:SAM-dependent methyltransferase